MQTTKVYENVGEPTEAALRVLVEKIQTDDAAFNEKLAGLSPMARVQACNENFEARFTKVCTPATIEPPASPAGAPLPPFFPPQAGRRAGAAQCADCNAQPRTVPRARARWPVPSTVGDARVFARSQVHVGARGSRR